MGLTSSQDTGNHHLQYHGNNRLKNLCVKKRLEAKNRCQGRTHPNKLVLGKPERHHSLISLGKMSPSQNYKMYKVI